MSAASEIAKHLGGHRIAQDEYRWHCPVHGDQDRSLDVRDRPDGSVLVICRVGCNQIDVIRALQDKGLWPQRDPSQVYIPTGTASVDEAEAKRMRAFALRIWSEARDPRHTLGEQ